MDKWSMTEMSALAGTPTRRTSRVNDDDALVASALLRGPVFLLRSENTVND
jgi:hypothetical protein